MTSFSVIPLEQDDDPLTPISTPGIEQKKHIIVMLDGQRGFLLCQHESQEAGAACVRSVLHGRVPEVLQLSGTTGFTNPRAL